MKKLATLLVGLALVSMAVPASSNEGVTERNRAWFIENTFPGADLSAPVQLAGPDGGRDATRSDVIDILVARAGNHDLSAIDLSEPRVAGSGVLAGDIWIYEYRSGVQLCNQGAYVGTYGHYDNIYADLYGTAGVGNYDPYAGALVAAGGVVVFNDKWLNHGVGDGTAIGGGFAIEFGANEADPSLGDYGFTTSATYYAGNSDFWCLAYYDFFFGWTTINFPYLNGIVTL